MPTAIPEKKLYLSNGFTLLELLLVLIIISVTVAFASPALARLLESYARLSVQQRFESDLKHAASLAASSATRVIFSVAASGDSYSYGADYLPYNTPPQPDSETFRTTLPASFSLSPRRTLLFDSRGFLVDSQGDPAGCSFTLSQNNLAAVTATIYPTGIVAFD